MILVKVEYDAYNQQFHLVDHSLAKMFMDGGMYLLAVDIFPNEGWNDEEMIGFPPAEIGHA